MRWFVVFLLIANMALYFWVQQQSSPPSGSDSIVPPDIGRLRLLGETVEPVSPALVPEEVGPVSVDEPPAVSIEPDAQPRPPIQAAVDMPPLPEVASPGASAIVPEPQAAGDTQAEAAATEDAVAAVVSNSDQVQSVSTRQTADAPPDSDTDEPPVVTEPLLSCARVGPFEPADADALAANLPAQLTLLADTTEETVEVDAYYVLIPALADRAAGLAKLAELEAAGVSDTWLFRAGPYRNAISLGLFRRQSSAERHAEAVAKKGFETRVQERGTTRERRWLVLRQPGNDAIAGAIPLPDGVSVNPQPCP